MSRSASSLTFVAGEMVSILLLALTARFIGFAQTTLEAGAPLTIQRTLAYVADILAIFTRIENLALLALVLAIASLVRIGVTYANRSVLQGLRERAGIAKQDLSWGDRAMRLPFAVVYRGLSGIATLVGAIALALCFRLFNPQSPFGIAELGSYAQTLASGITYAGVGALAVLFLLYGVALAVIGYIASPAVLSLEEMASGCRPEPEAPQQIVRTVH